MRTCLGMPHVCRISGILQYETSDPFQALLPLPIRCLSTTDESSLQPFEMNRHRTPASLLAPPEVFGFGL